MIGEGLAKAYTKYPFSRAEAYVGAEKKAQEGKVGMWKLAPTSTPTR